MPPRVKPEVAGAGSCANRVLRGGSFNNNNNNVRCANRNNNNPNNRNNNNGFRVIALIFFAPGNAGRVRLAGRGRKKAEPAPGPALWQGHIPTAPCPIPSPRRDWQGAFWNADHSMMPHIGTNVFVGLVSPRPQLPQHAVNAVEGPTINALKDGSCHSLMRSSESKLGAA